MVIGWIAEKPLEENHFYIREQSEFVDYDSPEGEITITYCKTKEKAEQLKKEIIEALKITERLDKAISFLYSNQSNMGYYEIRNLLNSIRKGAP